jgi:hypothetical protein
LCSVKTKVTTVTAGATKSIWKSFIIYLRNVPKKQEMKEL